MTDHAANHDVVVVATVVVAVGGAVVAKIATSMDRAITQVRTTRADLKVRLEIPTSNAVQQTMVVHRKEKAATLQRTTKPSIMKARVRATAELIILMRPHRA